MNWKMIVGGLVGILVALGFVFPQIAQLRTVGMIGPGGGALLFAGVLGSFCGAWCALRGFLHRDSITNS